MSAEDDAVEGSRRYDHSDDPRVAEWILRMRTGERARAVAAFGELCWYFRPTLLRMAIGRLPNDAEDAVQEVMIRAWRFHEAIKSPGFFFTTMKRLLMDRAKAEERRERLAKEMASQIAITMDFDAAIDAKKRARCFGEAHAILPKEDRVLLDARRRKMTVDDIAEAFQKPKRTVERHLKRIVEHVSALVQRCMEGTPR